LNELEHWHAEEEQCRRAIAKRSPNHPILKKYFPSTYKACEEYWKVLRELGKGARARATVKGKQK